MSKQQNQSRALTREERSHLSALASDFSFWSDVRDRSQEWDGTLTAGQYARLVEAMQKYPSILCGRPIRNRRSKDGQVHCWRSKDGCHNVAAAVVDRVGVCSEHLEAQRADAERYAASRPPKPHARVTDAPPIDPKAERARTTEALKVLATLLDPTNDGATA